MTTSKGAGSRAVVALLAVLVILALAPASAPGQEVTYVGGIQYAGGHYVFEDRTEAVYINTGVRVEWEALELGLSLPIAIQNGGLVTVVGGVPIPTGGRQSGVIGRRSGGKKIGSRPDPASIGGLLPTWAGSGGAAAQDGDTLVEFDPTYSVRLGDPTINVARELYSSFGTVRSVRVDGRASVPINDLDSGVGTGEWDYALGLSAALGVGRMLLFADASYWWFGDLPELELQDGLSYGLGAGFPLRDGRASALLTFSGMSQTVATVEAPMSVGASVGWTVGERTFMNLGAGAGLTESSADFFAQVGWTVSLSSEQEDVTVF